jgi:hypothetical protein
VVVEERWDEVEAKEMKVLGNAVLRMPDGLLTALLMAGNGMDADVKDQREGKAEIEGQTQSER